NLRADRAPPIWATTGTSGSFHASRVVHSAQCRIRCREAGVEQEGAMPARGTTWSKTATARVDLRAAVALLAFAAFWVALPVASRDGAAVTHALAQGIAPSGTRVPVGLREAASASVGSDEARYHARRSGDGFVATSGKLTSRFRATGVRVGGVTL